MVRNTNNIHGFLRLSNHPTLIQVVFPDLLFDERKFYFTLRHVKLNNSECETSI